MAPSVIPNRDSSLPDRSHPSIWKEFWNLCWQCSRAPQALTLPQSVNVSWAQQHASQSRVVPMVATVEGTLITWWALCITSLRPQNHPVRYAHPLSRWEHWGRRVNWLIQDPIASTWWGQQLKESVHSFFHETFLRTHYVPGTLGEQRHTPCSRKPSLLLIRNDYKQFHQGSHTNDDGIMSNKYKGHVSTWKCM